MLRAICQRAGDDERPCGVEQQMLREQPRKPRPRGPGGDHEVARAQREDARPPAKPVRRRRRRAPVGEIQIVRLMPRDHRRRRSRDEEHEQDKECRVPRLTLIRRIVNLRTIQRSESEASASLPSKKALASALDLDVHDLDYPETRRRVAYLAIANAVSGIAAEPHSHGGRILKRSSNPSRDCAVNNVPGQAFTSLHLCSDGAPSNAFLPARGLCERDGGRP